MTEQERSPNPDSAPRRGVGEATERVQELLAAAEQTARGILEDAEAEAQRRLEEAGRDGERLLAEITRLVSEFADELLKQTETVRHRADELKRAARKLTSERDVNLRRGAASMPRPSGLPAQGAESGSLVLRPAEPEEKPSPRR